MEIERGRKGRSRKGIIEGDGEVDRDEDMERGRGRKERPQKGIG